MSDVSCRILVVSSTLDASLDLVKRVRTLGRDEAVPEVVVEDGAGEVEIPWTIKNKYYTADVHYIARPVKGTTPVQYQGVPAVIFAWRRGEAYKHHIARLGSDMKNVEPEVSLAVRLPSPDFIADEDKEDEEEKNEETSAVDEYLSTNGFEFVDVSSPTEHEVEPDTIPSLPRVLDALSTIMWPSMQTSKKASKQPGRQAGSSTSAFLDWAETSFDSSTTEEDHPPSKLNAEITELAKWLEEGDAEDLWQPTHYSTSPAGADSKQAWGEDSKTPLPPVSSQNAFDDDFSMFVTAPASTPLAHANADESFEHASFDVSFDSELLSATTFGQEQIMYHSLGSHSDIGEAIELPGGHERLDSEDEDDDTDALPSKDEIRESAQRIFGGGLRPAGAPVSGRNSDNADDEVEFDLAPFDLGQVMSALQGMKAEIAGMDDESERRKAAARVALGLVYGLDSNDVDSL